MDRRLFGLVCALCVVPALATAQPRALSVAPVEVGVGIGGNNLLLVEWRKALTGSISGNLSETDALELRGSYEGRERGWNSTRSYGSTQLLYRHTWLRPTVNEARPFILAGAWHLTQSEHRDDGARTRGEGFTFLVAGVGEDFRLAPRTTLRLEMLAAVNAIGYGRVSASINVALGPLK